MTTPSSTITAGDVNTELGRSSTASMSLNEEKVRRLADQTSGTVTFDNLRNKSRTKTYNSGQVVPSRSRSIGFSTEFIKWSGNTSYYVPRVVDDQQYNCGSLDVDIYDTTAYANASIQTQNLTLTIGLTWDSYKVDGIDTNFGLVFGIKPAGYPFQSFSDYSNQNSLINLNSGSYSGGRVLTGTVTQSYSLSNAVSFGDTGGWSFGYTGQWNTGKISRTDHVLAISMNILLDSGWSNNQPITIHYAQISGSYSI